MLHSGQCYTLLDDVLSAVSRGRMAVGPICSQQQMLTAGRVSLLVRIVSL